MTKQEMNNRANQLNPNNELYWKSRGYNPGSNKAHNNNQNHDRSNNNSSKNNNSGRVCIICKRQGRITCVRVGMFGTYAKVKCGYCGGVYDIDL